MIQHIRYSILSLVMGIFLFPLIGYSQSIPEVQGFVNDYKNLFTSQQRTQLNAYLTNFAETTSNEISVATLDLPPGENLEDYTFKVAEKWGIGGKSNDNGVLIAVYPDSRKMRIEVGYGLEGAVPDIVAHNIMEQYMKPAFQVKDYYTGVANAAQIVAGLSKGEYDDAPLRKYYSPRKRSVPNSGFSNIIVLILIIIVFSYMSRGGGGSDDDDYDGTGRRRRRRGGGWMFFPFPMGGGSGGGSSWGGGGGFSGGGFGGFGGGSFGGGGASGSW